MIGSQMPYEHSRNVPDSLSRLRDPIFVPEGLETGLLLSLPLLCGGVHFSGSRLWPVHGEWT